jgi:tetratricopeptide (TPR) repeat protein
LGRPDDAIVSFDNMREANSFTSSEYQNFGFYLHNYDYLDASNIYLAEAIRLNPKLVEPRITATANLGNQKRYEEAMAVADEALRLFPNEPRLVRNKYLLFMHQGRLGEATSFLIEKMFDGSGLGDIIPESMRSALRTNLRM